MQGNKKEFAINKALSEMGDLRLLGEINTFHRAAELKKMLEDMLKEVHSRVKEVMKELIKVEIVLDDLKKQLELANAYCTKKSMISSIPSLISDPTQDM